MTSKLIFYWLPCQLHDVLGSVLGLVVLVSVHCDRVGGASLICNFSVGVLGCATVSAGVVMKYTLICSFSVGVLGCASLSSCSQEVHFVLQCGCAGLYHWVC